MQHAMQRASPASPVACCPSAPSVRLFGSPAGQQPRTASAASTSYRVAPTTSCRSIQRSSLRALMTTEVLQVVAPPPLPKLLRLSHRQKDVRFEGFEHGVFTVAGQQALQAPAALVYTLLADWDACAEVFHNIQRSEVVRLLPEGMLVKQTCRWSFLAFSGHFDCTFVVRQDSEARTLEFKLRDSSFMRDFRGTWRVTPAVLQSQDSAAPACLVEHTLSVKPLMDMPEPVAKLASGIFLQQVASILDDLANEVDKKMAQRQ